MKANELMIGDWVRWKNKHVQVASVSGVVWSFGHIDVELAYCNDDHLLESHDIKSISPIPLTPEILEKNGFYNCEHRFYLGDSDDVDCWSIDISENTPMTIHVVQGCNEIRVHILYIHQLQHALRLVGLNDLADKFIIK